MGPKWTRLFETGLWNMAKDRYDSDRWRVYHDFSHPQFMYTMAQDYFGFEYSRDLDVAILAHDVIYSGPAPEAASWNWLCGASLDLDEKYATPKVKDLIISTAEHRPGRDNRLILLDLSGFMLDIRKTHTQMLRREAFLRDRVSDTDFDGGTKIYLTGLLERIETGLNNPDVPGDDVPYFEFICKGIRKTIDELRSDRTPEIS